MPPDSSTSPNGRESPRLKLNPGESQVFIIADQEHRECAKSFCQYLKEGGVPVFLSTSPEQGTKDPSKEIATNDSELLKATHMVILISTDPKREAGYVEHVFKKFLANNRETKTPLRALILHVGHLPDLDEIPEVFQALTIEEYSAQRFDDYIRILWPEGEEKASDDSLLPEETRERGPDTPNRVLKGVSLRLILAGGALVVMVMIGAVVILPLLDGDTSPMADSNHTKIRITSVPAMGSSGQVVGMVDPDSINDNKVLVFIKVYDRWWGPKPGYADPFVSIDPQGEWRCTIFTGGEDLQASEVTAALVPSSMHTAPEAHGERYLPYQINQYPQATAHRG